ncbi:unnamed protein product [Rotaria sp. Silwood1]|nr:unnamed protein product [Rotaria sp. Silwood1]
MSSASHSFTAPVLLRARNFQWYWNSIADPWSANGQQWQKYTDVENEIIEDAINQKMFDIEIDGDYIINLECLLQYKRGDEFTACPIKRVQLDKYRSNIHPREERFLLPVILATSTFSSQETQNEKELDWLRTYGYITGCYWNLQLQNKNKTIAEVVEEAAHGIIKEGSAIGKVHEAQWLSQQLVAVKGFGSNINANFIQRFPSEIGETCAYLYTKESFWYKLINRILRDPHSITLEQVKSLGPFCWLLDWYLYDNPTTDVLTVYRSLNLDDEQQKQFMEEVMKFTSFISTSRSREVADFYDGNTLLIIDLNLRHKDNERTLCGRDVSSLSDFPEEEEFLIWPGRDFGFVRYEYDIVKKKHVIYLKSLIWD